MKQTENGWLNLLLNIILPTLVLVKLSTPEFLGPKLGLIVALAFPITYALYSMIRFSQFNWISVIGFVSVLLTGGIGLLEIDTKWIAFKEAAIPGIIGIGLLFFYKRTSILDNMLTQLLDMPRIKQALSESNNVEAFDMLKKRAVLGVACSFFISSFLNYALASYIVKSPSGTPAFTEELGKLTALSFPVIALPATLVLMGVIWYLIIQLKKLTKLNIEQIFILDK